MICARAIPFFLVRFCRLCLLVSVAVGVWSAASAQDRYAAVIDLAITPASPSAQAGLKADAAHIANTLEDTGFAVRRFSSASTGDVRRAVFWLGENLAASPQPSFGVVYVTGYGAEAFGRTYLLSTDARTDTPRAVAASGAPVDLLVEQLDAHNAHGLLFLDLSMRAAPDMPEGLRAGAAALDPPRRGVVVLDNPPGLTAPGRGADVSVFAQQAAAVMRSDATPRAALRTFAREVRNDSMGWRTPWIAGQLPNDLVLHGPAKALGAPRLRGAAATPPMIVLATTQGVRTSPWRERAPASTDIPLDAFEPQTNGALLLARLASESADLIDGAALRSLVEGSSVTVLLAGFAADLQKAAAQAESFALSAHHSSPLIVLDWGSLGERSPVGYAQDTDTAPQAGPELRQLLAQLRDAGAREVNLLAYGLGARAAASAVQAHDTQVETEAPMQPPPFSQIILIAPDLPATTHAEDLLALQSHTSALTLLMSDADLDAAARQRWRSPATASAAAPSVLIDAARALDIPVTSFERAPNTPLWLTPEAAAHVAILLNDTAPHSAQPLSDAHEIAPDAPILAD